jgi:hypothetical protein
VYGVQRRPKQYALRTALYGSSIDIPYLRDGCDVTARLRGSVNAVVVSRVRSGRAVLGAGAGAGERSLLVSSAARKARFHVLLLLVVRSVRLFSLSLPHSLTLALLGPSTTCWARLLHCIVIPSMPSLPPPADSPADFGFAYSCLARTRRFPPRYPELLRQRAYCTIRGSLQSLPSFVRALGVVL